MRDKKEGGNRLAKGKEATTALTHRRQKQRHRIQENPQAQRVLHYVMTTTQGKKTKRQLNFKTCNYAVNVNICALSFSSNTLNPEKNSISAPTNNHKKIQKASLLAQW